MAYSSAIKLRAYTLYLQGDSFEGVAIKIREEFSVKITANTIRLWEEEENWENERQKLGALMRENTQERITTKLTELAEKANIIQETLFKRMMDTAPPKISSMEGVTYAWKTISEFLVTLNQQSTRDMSPIVVVQALLDILGAIPAVRDAIEQNWPQIEKEISARIVPKRMIENERAKHT